MEYFGLLDVNAPELLVVLVILLLLFGGKKLPELAGSLGRTVKEVKKGVREASELRNEAQNQVKEVKEAWKGDSVEENPRT